MISSMLVTTPCLAWLAPSFNLASGFSSIQTTDVLGATYKSASSARLDFKPQLNWINTRTFSEFTIGANIQYFKFSPPNDDIVLSQNVFVRLGGDVRYSFQVSSFTISLKGDYNQIPVLNVKTPLDLNFSKIGVFTTPIDLTYKLIAIERKAIQLGAGGFLFSPFNSRISSSNGYNAHLDYEIRGPTKINFIFYYDFKTFVIDSNTQKSTEIGLNLKVSFLGSQGMIPPPDERSL